MPRGRVCDATTTCYARASSMILRDPVHGLVAFEGKEEPVVQALLGAREVQRLRRVRQLGLTSLVFPGAEHSRFSHALGAAHVMTRLLARARATGGDLPVSHRVDDVRARDAVAAALLHDLGHGPFSHLFEEVLEHARAHEDWTIDVIRDPSTDVHRALASCDPEMPARVAALVEGTGGPRWLTRAVSGPLDVDRCDYLLRDSHMTGVAYGLYDLEWLLRALTFAELPSEAAPAGDRWALAIEGRKGLPPIEGFFLARHFMYQQVYHHKATRGAECLVRAVFRRVAMLVRDGHAPEPLPHALRAAILGEPLSLDRYLALDDVMLLHCLAEWETGRDATLAELAASLRHRRLPKTVPLDETDEASWGEAYARAEEVARRRGMDPSLSVWLDVARDLPYEEDGQADGLWVALRHQPLVRLGDVSFALAKLKNQPIVRPRLVFLESLRDEVLSAIEEVLA